MADSLSIMAFSVIGEKKKDVVVRLRHSDARIGEDEAFAIAKSVDHPWRDVTLDRSVRSVFEELRELRAAHA
jgi:hypothetical protein